MFAILIGAAGAAVYTNLRNKDKLKVRTMNKEECATMEYGIDVMLNQNNDYLFWGQKHMQTLDSRTRPYRSYGEAVEKYNKRFDNKARLVNELLKVRNPTFIVPRGDDHLVKMKVITPFMLDPAYQASQPKALRFQSTGGWY
jgi:hypothetical protein